MDTAVDLACFKELLLQTCGHRFEQEREHALAGALRRRMSVLNIKRRDTYHARLLRDNDELLRLVELLTVNETYFFREPEHLKMVIDRLPELIAGDGRRPVRILSAGCSTGEEPYSIAMLLRERYGDDSERLFAITGIDINAQVIEFAQRGVYGASSFRGINDALLERYFKRSGPGEFTIADNIRRQVGFEVANLLHMDQRQPTQPPDVILYRNVSIYFPGSVQERIFRKLAELLVDGGCLVVGASETMHHDLGILSLVQQDSLFYYRKTPRRAGTGARPPYSGQRQDEGLRAVFPPGLAAANAEPGRNPRHSGNAPKRAPTPPPADKSADLGARYEKALELARDHCVDKSLALIGSVIAEDASFTRAYVLKADLLLSEARFEEAADVCNAALEHRALSPEIHLILGLAARQQGEDDEALKRFREAVFLDTSCWLAQYHAADIHLARGDKKRARSGYEAALRILGKDAARNPDHETFPLAVNVDQYIAVCQHKLSQFNRS